MLGARLERVVPGDMEPRAGLGLAGEASRGDAAPEWSLWMVTERAQLTHSLGTWRAGLAGQSEVCGLEHFM